MTMLNKLSFAFAALNIILCHFPICTTGNLEIPVIAKYFCTKIRYEEVNPHLLDGILNVNSANVKSPSTDCKAVHITAILRHGTRYPSKKYINVMKEMHYLVVDEAKARHNWLQDLQTKWKMSYDESMDGGLTSKGQDDHSNLAVRLAKSFPTLISKENLQKFRFITSSKQRCVDSIIAFKKGLKDLWKTEDLKPHEVKDELMRFFDQCKRYKDIRLNQTEKVLFMSNPEMTKVRERLTSRLQVPFRNLTTGLAEAAFLLCAYDFAIKTENSPWCRMFNEEDAQVLEYSTDLHQFRLSHQYRNSSCALFLDVFSRLDRVVSESRSGQVTEAVTVQMGHAETLMPLLTLLGFFEGDEDLTSSNYASQKNRKFRTSRIMPYAANLVLVLYKCSDGFRLQTLLNEKPEDLFSVGSPAPLYDKVKEHYKNLLEDCNYKKKC